MSIFPQLDMQNRESQHGTTFSHDQNQPLEGARPPQEVEAGGELWMPRS